MLSSTCPPKISVSELNSASGLNWGERFQYSWPCQQQPVFFARAIAPVNPCDEKEELIRHCSGIKRTYESFNIPVSNDRGLMSIHSIHLPLRSIEAQELSGNLPEQYITPLHVLADAADRMWTARQVSSSISSGSSSPVTYSTSCPPPPLKRIRLEETPPTESAPSSPDIIAFPLLDTSERSRKDRPELVPFPSSYKPIFSFVKNVYSYSINRDAQLEYRPLYPSQYPEYTPLIDLRVQIIIEFSLRVNELFIENQSDFTDLVHVIGQRVDGKREIYPLTSIASMGSIKSHIAEKKGNVINGQIRFKPSQLSTKTDMVFSFYFWQYRFFDRAIILTKINEKETAIERAWEKMITSTKSNLHDLIRARETSVILPIDDLSEQPN